MATHALPAAEKSLWTDFVEWVTTVDHKRIGILYIGLNFFFFVLAGVMALIIRAQLAWSNLKVVDPDRYNEIFTMHGTTMIFLVIVPIWAGFANYMLPLMIGARDMAFPRLNALSFWFLFFGGLVMYSSYFFGEVPNAGWTSYPPLTADRTYAPGGNIDFWILGLHLVGLSSIFGAINFLVTTFNMRAPGMKLLEVPMFVWSMVITSIMVLFATPMLATAISLLLADRHFGTNFFIPAGGGDPLLWQNLFWFYSHPAVYIMILPSMGLVSEVLPVFSRKPLFGYNFIAMSSVFIALLGFSVWAHHMFQVGSSLGVNTFFSLMTMIIGVPTGVKIFNWTATLWGGALRLEPPMLFAIGMVTMFIIGGLSGVMLGSVPVNWNLHQTYFVVAHLHYVLFGGSVFGIFSALYYWLPKMTGFKLGRTLGNWNFWLMFIGFNLTFFPQHLAGIEGMPRRIYTYAAGQGIPLSLGGINFTSWELYNLLSTLGAFIIALSVLVFIINFFMSAAKNERAGDNPWEAATLEWATSSPPPDYNFAHIPVVHGHNPLWEKHPEGVGAGTNGKH